MYCIFLGTSVISIGLDEGTVYWTDGSVVSSVSRVAPSSPVSSSNIFGVTALLSLSPDQQPQYSKHTTMHVCIQGVYVYTRFSTYSILSIYMYMYMCK